MRTSLQPDVLRRSVGQKMRNSHGESIGKVVEIIRDDNTQAIQYLILRSSIFYGVRKRYFAIPASPVLFQIDKDENVILIISADDLVLAKGTVADHYPKPLFKRGQPIFELYNYQEKDDGELDL